MTTFVMAIITVIALPVSVFSQTILNPSFESQSLENNAFNIGTATDWTILSGTVGAFNPGSSFYSSGDGADDSSTSGAIGAMDGTNAVFMTGGSVSAISQILTDSIVVGETYTLTIAVGDRDAGGAPGFAGYDIRLLAGDVVVASVTSADSLGDGTFTDVSLVYTAEDSDSGVFGIQFGTLDGVAGSGKSTDFDNVRLVVGDASVDPEPVSELVINTPHSRQIVQRLDDEASAVVVSGSFGGAHSVEARATAIEGSGTDVDWVVIDDEPGANGFEGDLMLLEGWYSIDVRALDAEGNILKTETVSLVGVGDIYIVAGQSNAANWGESKQSADDDRVSYYNVGSSWKHAVDLPDNPAAGRGTKGAPWPELGDLIAESENVPVGFVVVADGGSSVTEWLPSGSDNYPNLKEAVQAFPTNGFKAVLWHQGEKDNANNGNSDPATRGQYAQNLKLIIAETRSDAGWDVPWGVAKVGYIKEGLDQDLLDAQQSVIDDDANVFLGSDTDLLVGTNPDTGLDWRHDGTHLSNEGLEAHAAMWFEAIQAKKLLGDPEGDFDQDGVKNSDDAFPGDPDESLDTDGDGVGNNEDLDDDGDGVLDADDAFPLDPEKVGVIDPEPTVVAGEFVNISTRAFVKDGNGVVVGGFVIEGTDPMLVLVQGVGLELEDDPFKVMDPLEDTEIVLYQGDTVIASNDDWDSDSDRALEITDAGVVSGSFVLQNGSKSSAVLELLEPGLYTVHLRGKSGRSGVGLVEVYDISMRVDE